MKLDYLDSLDERMDIARRVLRYGDPANFFDQAVQMDNFNVNLLYGYVRSFVKLAYLGDVRAASDQLRITRQSIKRHILELENLLDVQLFERVGATSRLTSMGTLWLPRAQEFSELAAAFLNRRGANQAHYQSTQLPFRMLLNDRSNSRLLHDFANAWLCSNQTLDCEAIRPFREQCIVYERKAGAWVSREIGEKSAFCLWFGSKITKASVGQRLAKMETGDDLQDEIAFLLDSVYTRGGVHFSEVACNLHSPNHSGRIPVLYQRLLAELTDEYDRPVVASIIEITDPLQKGLAHD